MDQTHTQTTIIIHKQTKNLFHNITNVIGSNTYTNNNYHTQTNKKYVSQYNKCNQVPPVLSLGPWYMGSESWGLLSYYHHTLGSLSASIQSAVLDHITSLLSDMCK